MPIDTYHVVLVGDCGVGKTSIINRYVHHKYNRYQTGSEAVESIKHIVEYNREFLNLCFHDTPGQPIMAGIVNKYVEELADVVIFVVSPKTKESGWLKISERIKKMRG